jgi:peptidoglycan/LPS O-acetylase OafA/YrhL
VSVATPASRPQPIRFTQIEHLRAVAVLVVIVHHLGGMPGGFIGVDIFFVISGFVITHALLGSRDLGFLAGVRHFYYRRIVRILPPLIVVTLASFLFGWWLFFDDDFTRLQQAVASQAYFLQNLHFAQDVGNYFRGIPATDVALHTWSLAVEEQFYLLSPVLIILLIRMRRRAPRTAAATVLAVAVTATIAAIASETPLTHLTATAVNWWSPARIDPDALRFYSLPFRAWELLLGCSAMAVRSRWDHRLSMLSTRAQPFFYIGLAALLAAAYLDLERRTWPNLYTLGVCLLTAGCLVLVVTRPVPAQPGIGVSRALAAVGSTSYSAYLWHWPLLGYFTYTNFDFGVARLDYALYFLVLAALVAATYHTVEKHRLRISGPASVVVLLAFIVGGRYLGTSPRDLTWFDQDKQRILSTARYDQARCENDVEKVAGKFVVLFGDSHAGMVTGQFQRSAREHGYSVLCMEGSRARLGSDRRATEARFERVARAEGYLGTLMVLRWNMYSTGFPPYEVEERGNRFLMLDDRRPANATEAFDFFVANMTGLVRSIARARPSAPIGILLQVPNMPFYAEKESLMDYHGLRFRALPPKSAAEHRSEQMPVRRVFDRLRAAEPAIDLLDPTSILCGADTCAYRHGWNVLYKDDDHLSVYGETLLAPLFERWLRQLHARDDDGRS